jgi:hypothetical protein
MVDEVLDELVCTKWFSKLDLKDDYYRITMVESDGGQDRFSSCATTSPFSNTDAGNYFPNDNFFPNIDDISRSNNTANVNSSSFKTPHM